MVPSNGCYVHPSWADGALMCEVEGADAAVWHRRGPLDATPSGSYTPRVCHGHVRPAISGLHASHVATVSMPNGRGRCKYGWRNAVTRVTPGWEHGTEATASTW